jgi:formylglycine-generating enzyme required for sulfatase activity
MSFAFARARAMTLHIDVGAEPIAGYALVRLLGRGGFGEVWEAVAPGEVRVALKFIRLDSDEAGVEQRALNVIRNIRHPHLLDVQFAARVGDCLVIAMPLCDACLLDRLHACQKKGLPGLPRDELMGYMVDLARAVDYLNEPRHPTGDGTLVGVQHRDIKPHNIFLVGDSVRLADFGLAKILQATRRSHTGGMSVDYVAPEVPAGQVTRWSDQYSLAATYLHLRTGKLPFEGDSLVQIIYAHMHTPPDLSGLPEEERPVVARALAKKPEERWPTCREFVRALVAARSGDARRSSRSGSGSPTQGASKPPKTEGPAPFPNIRIDEESPSAVGAEKAAPGFRKGWFVGLVALAAILAGLLAVIAIPRLLPTSERAPQTSPEIVAKDTNRDLPKKSEPGPPVGKPREEPPKSITSKAGVKLVLIPAGQFEMGSPDSHQDAQGDEKPRHPVRITRPFYLGMTEVTQAQYRTVTGENPSNFKRSEDLPVEQVSWHDAIAFCNKLSELDGLKPYYRLGTGERLGGDGYRLPTEAEWEYACRAGNVGQYSIGDDPASLGDHAWLDDNSGGQTHNVGRKRPNAFGLFDMYGNVWEWCGDGYNPDYYKKSPIDDPAGPSSATGRVRRGGSWGSIPLYVRSADRDWSTPIHRGNFLGFRVARGLPAQ